ncbi:MAG: alpha-glucosidase/alpha-galactosidase [Clostridia bacterium]|nr:alpha-glucosidase/alpha-galactosidase [Clostridia bacterium]
MFMKPNVKIAYIGGGSRGWAHTLMVDLAKEDAFNAEVYLYDIDKKAAEKNAKIGNDLLAREDIAGKHTYVVASAIEDALTDADFVVLSILPATFMEMQSDVHLPEEYGIYQSVGDTSGPGGILRAMRTVPLYKGFAQKIKECCPDAWVINYTNPMTLCTATLYRTFPEIKAFGCCHEVFGTQKLIAAALKEFSGIDIPHKEVKITVSGVNHFTWITKAQYQNIDLFEIYREFADRHYEEGFELTPALSYKNNYFTCSHRVKFDLFRRCGAIAAAGDRHLAEFCPGKWYLENPEKADKWHFALTPVSYRIDDLKKRIDRTEKLYTGQEPFTLRETGEEGVLLMKTLLGITPSFVTNCNLPNRGQCPDLPLGAIVETNAEFSANSLKPVIADALPPLAHNLVARIVNEQQALLTAILAHDYDAVFECFAQDPLVTISYEKARELFLRMMENTKEYIPYGEEYLEKQKQPR